MASVKEHLNAVNILRARIWACVLASATRSPALHGEARPLTILGDLVHNATVSTALQAKGIAAPRPRRRQDPHRDDHGSRLRPRDG